MRPAGTISDATIARRRSNGGGRRLGPAAFTLVELLVTMVIIAILAALMLAGFAGVRQGAKADKTRNTIRKIDAVIRPMYDSYRNRRVSQAVAGASTRNYDKLFRDKRMLVIYEMPDQWSDVPSSLSTVPTICQTAAVRSYVSAPGAPSPLFRSAECLYMILERSGFDADALEFFRPDEIGDVDQDGKKEFLDGWGRPIAFIRWAPGFVSDPSSVTLNPRRYSPIQVADSVNAHDPLDPTGRDPTAYALVPLIYSAGPDGALGSPTDDVTGYGLQLGPTGGWLANAVTLLPNLCTGPAATVGTPLPGNESLDNITNHDLLKK
ncbi:MAG: type II secretion system protein [Planctomycetota bacterium]